MRLIANRALQNPLGERIVDIRAVINKLLQHTGSYTATKRIMRNDYHIFIHIDEGETPC